MGANIHNIHDKFFKQLMSHTDIARDFFYEFLPTEVTQSLDLNSLEYLRESYISEDMKESVSDIILRCGIHGIEESCNVCILLEHKSYKAKYASVQVMRYVAQAYQKQLDEKGTLELIIPLIFYHGSDKWEYHSLEDLLPKYPSIFKQYILNCGVEFINVQEISDEELVSVRNDFLVSSLIIQKHSSNPEYLERKVRQIFESLPIRDTRNLIISIAVYYLRQVNNKNILKETSEKFLERDLKEKIMTAYEVIKKDGVEEGLQKGLQEGLQEGLQKGRNEVIVKTITSAYEEGLSIDVIAKITSVTEKRIKRILREEGLIAD